jgi:hypothetical protein
MQLSFHDVSELERTMDILGSAANVLCDKDTRKKVADLRYLIAELRVLSANPQDPVAINRFMRMFTE